MSLAKLEENKVRPKLLTIYSFNDYFKHQTLRLSVRIGPPHQKLRFPCSSEPGETAAFPEAADQCLSMHRGG